MGSVNSALGALRAALRTSQRIMQAIPRTHYAQPPAIGWADISCKPSTAEGEARRLAQAMLRQLAAEHTFILAEHRSPEGATSAGLLSAAQPRRGKQAYERSPEGASDD